VWSFRLLLSHARRVLVPTVIRMDQQAWTQVGCSRSSMARQTVGVRYHRGPAVKTSAQLVAGAVGADEKIGGPAELMAEGDVMDVRFVTSVAVITPDLSVSRGLYVDALGLPLTGEGDGYLHSEDIDGCKSFGVWPLTQAAQACFGMPDWPSDRPVPQASVEFEVVDAGAVQVAAEELNLNPPTGCWVRSS
jgi:hypothetical protein